MGDTDRHRPAFTQGMKVFGAEQTAFDAEAAAIGAVVRWVVQQGPPGFRFMVAHPVSASAVAGVSPYFQHAS